MKTLLFLDTEFNGSKLAGFGGELISMGIVSGSSINISLSHRFYEVIKYSEDKADPWKGLNIDPWVLENVIPVTNKNPISYKEFQGRLEKFLNDFSSEFIIISDWPDDVKYFCESLITDPGKMLNVQSFQARVERVDYIVKSNIPHNALEDAIALRETLLKMHNYSLY